MFIDLGGADPDKPAQIPCFKLNQRFGYGQLSQVMQLEWSLAGCCGCWKREGGSAGELTLVDRPYPELTVKRTSDILFNQAL